MPAERNVHTAHSVKSSATLTLAVLEELDAFLQRRVPQHDHMFGHVLDEAEEAALRVEPRVRAQLLLVRLQRLDNARDAKLVVPLRAIQCPVEADTDELRNVQLTYTALWKNHLSFVVQQTILDALLSQRGPKNTKESENTPSQQRGPCKLSWHETLTLESKLLLFCTPAWEAPLRWQISGGLVVPSVLGEGCLAHQWEIVTRRRLRGRRVK